MSSPDMLDTMTETPGRDVLRELAPLHRDLRRAIPDVYTWFGALSAAAFEDGALGRKTKELTAFDSGETPS